MLPAQEILKFPYDKRKVLTVTELTNKIKNCLEENIGFVWVTGEISDLIYHTSGHVYFSLKDADSQIRAILWRDKAQKLNFRLEDGLEVIVLGKITVYIRGGNYQISVEVIEPKGIGALQLKFEELKKRLAKEGLFDESRKRPIPLLPSKIAIVTSIDGAAIRDILNVINSRFPKMHILIYHVRVQGEGAAEEIATAINEINLKYSETDVMIVGRGGGSLEDLWQFNEEIVARAIYKSRIPIISAIGHEVDYTIADFVADKRAKTPTDAGNIVVPKYEEIIAQLEQDSEKLKSALKSWVSLAYQKLDGYKDNYILNRPRDLIHEYSQRLDELNYRLSIDLPKFVNNKRDILNILTKSHAFRLPKELINQYYKRLKDLSNNININILHIHRLIKDRIEAISAHLDAVTPLKILSRGYSVTLRKSDGKIIRNARDVTEGEEIISKLAEGEIHSRVLKKIVDSLLAKE